MSGGGGGGRGFDPLQTAVILGASIAAPYAAPALFGAGAGLGTIALTGAGIGGLGSALIGRDPLMGALGGGLGGLGAGAAGLNAGAAATAPGSLAASAAPTVAGTGATLAPTVVPGALSTTGGVGFGTLGAGTGALGGAGAGSTFGSLAAPSAFGVSSLAPTGTSFLAGTGAAGGAGAAGTGGLLGSMGITPKMAGYGAGALGLMSLAGQDKKQYGQPTTDQVTYKGGPLSKFTYDPSTYQPDVVKPPLPPYQPVYAAGGGLMGLRAFSAGGRGHLGGYSDGARVLKGPGDGMSDSIPATIEGKQPARLADSEFVVPADVVSHIGNGSSDAGAKKLYKMMDRVRKARTGSVKQAKRITPEKYLPA
jgi:hypothetical protein